MGSQGGFPWDPRVGPWGPWSLGDPWALGTLGPWGPLGLGDPLALGDPWALGTLGLGDPLALRDPWALGTLGLGDPWALGARALGPVYYIYGSTLVPLCLIQATIIHSG